MLSIYLKDPEPDITFANIEKITKFKWKTKVPFEKGVKIMLNDIEKWKNAPLWNVIQLKKATQTWFKYMKN